MLISEVAINYSVTLTNSSTPVSSEVTVGLNALWSATPKHQGGNNNGVDTEIQCDSTT